MIRSRKFVPQIKHSRVYNSWRRRNIQADEGTQIIHFLEKISEKVILTSQSEESEAS